MTEAEILAVAAEHYPRLGNRNKLFDMTQADLSALSAENFTTIAKTVGSLQPEGVFPKTAFVAGDPHSYSTLSRYLLHVFHNRVHIEYRVFMDPLRAEEWLGAG